MVFPAIIVYTSVSCCQHSLHRDEDYRGFLVEPVNHMNSCYLLTLIIYIRLLNAALITINDDISTRLQLIRAHQDISVQGRPKHPEATKVQDPTCMWGRMVLLCQTVPQTKKSSDHQFAFRSSYPGGIQSDLDRADWVRKSARMREPHTSSCCCSSSRHQSRYLEPEQ